jgi:hypothetical protein
LEITPDEFSVSDYGNCLDTRKIISGNLFWLNNLRISWRSKKEKSVVSSTYEAEYMALALTTKQWIWLTKAIEELNVLVTDAAMF